MHLVIFVLICKLSTIIQKSWDHILSVFKWLYHLIQNLSDISPLIRITVRYLLNHFSHSYFWEYLESYANTNKPVNSCLPSYQLDDNSPLQIQNRKHHHLGYRHCLGRSTRPMRLSAWLSTVLQDPWVADKLVYPVVFVTLRWSQIQHRMKGNGFSHKAQIKPWTLAKLKAREHMLSTTVLQSLKPHPTLLHSPGQEKEGKHSLPPDSVPPHMS